MCTDASRRKHYQQRIDFTKIGGLAHHLKILRDTIIIPLLHANIYKHFNIKTPKGILFYGPPGTGKTLVAGALATELSREGIHVSLYQRKGADVLDKWVGESEKKLRAIFEMATKTRPSIIFFDEIDGLAPTRSTKNDHVHCSIVTTLLALMDGLDSVPGVIVIGATNRIEFVDTALRRPGRFDRELYFPLPSTEARKEILHVHMAKWRWRPSEKFVRTLAELTCGYCGADLQALCAETLMCAMKRLYPQIHHQNYGNKNGNNNTGWISKVKIEADSIRIEEEDFLKARTNLIPSSQKMGNKMRRLCSIVAPLLQRQLSEILQRLRMLWPHFSAQFHNYVVGCDRYAGRLVLNGSNLQGLNTHLVPAILQFYEHLPAYFIDITLLQNNNNLSFLHNGSPCIVILPRIDELWNILEMSEQTFITSLLEDIHSGLAVLIVATCEADLPLMLHDFFYNNTTLFYSIENPSVEEVEEFFLPIFFGLSSNKLNANNCGDYGNSGPSLMSCLLQNRSSNKRCYNRSNNLNHPVRKPLMVSSNIYKIQEGHHGKISKQHLLVTKRSDKLKIAPEYVDKSICCTYSEANNRKKKLPFVLSDLIKRSISFFTRKAAMSRRSTSGGIRKRVNQSTAVIGDGNDLDRNEIYNIWQRTCHQTAKDMNLANLEVLYDTISACINIHRDNYDNLIENLTNSLNEIESSNK